MSFNKTRYNTHEPVTLRTELIVRPDVLRVSMSVSLELEEPAQALPILQRACEQFLRRLRESLATEVRFRPRDARFDRAAPRKLAIPEDDKAFASVEGLLEISLPAELDFWARSARVGTLMRACFEAERDSLHSKKLPHLAFGTVEALVAQPEAHRAELLRRLVARARELAEALGSPAAPLHVVDCAPTGPVEQTASSLEEVGLTLPVQCRLGVVRAPGASDETPR